MMEAPNTSHFTSKADKCKQAEAQKKDMQFVGLLANYSEAEEEIVKDARRSSASMFFIR